MIRYETLILTVPEITADESAALEEQFGRAIKKGQGSFTSFERWGKYRLAYPVRKNDYGVYFLLRFEVGPEQVLALSQDIHALFTVKFPQFVVRYMTTKLDSEQALIYQKPDSLEDIPTQDVDTFLRENKMEGLLKGPGSSAPYEGRRRSERPAEGDSGVRNSKDSTIDEE